MKSNINEYRWLKVQEVQKALENNGKKISVRAIQKKLKFYSGKCVKKNIGGRGGVSGKYWLIKCGFCENKLVWTPFWNIEAIDTKTRAEISEVSTRTIRNRIHRDENESSYKIGNYWYKTIEDVSTDCLDYGEIAFPEQIENQNDNSKIEKIELVSTELNNAPRGSIQETAVILAERFGVSANTIYRWRREGKRKKNTKNLVYWKGLKFNTKLDPKLLEYFIKARLKNYWRTVKQILKEMRGVFDKMPSDRSFYRIDEQLHGKYYPLVLRAQKGLLSLDWNVVPQIYRDRRFYHSLEQIVGDQHIFDFIVEAPNGRYVRPQGYFWVDERSRFICGSAVTLGNYNKYTIGTSLMNCFSCFGVPTSIYTDWGKPELSKYIENVLSQLEGYGVMAYDIKGENEITSKNVNDIKHIRAKVRNPRAKIIESIFGTLERWLREECENVGYCKRKFDTLEDTKLIEDLRKDKKRGRILPYDMFFKKLINVIKAWNQHEIVSRKEKIVPRDVFFAEIDKLKQAGGLKKLKDSTLALIFLPNTFRLVRNSKIQLKIIESEFYVSPLLSAFPNGTKVEVRYNPDDIEKVWIFQEGEYVCQAKLWREINPKNHDDMMERLEIQAKIKKTWNDLYCSIIKPVGSKSTIHRQDANVRKINREKSELKRNMKRVTFRQLWKEGTNSG